MCAVCVCVLCVCDSLFLEKTHLESTEEEKDIIGQGGSGTVIYRARYREQPVAIKRFHFKKCRQQNISCDTGTEALTAYL